MYHLHNFGSINRTVHMSDAPDNIRDDPPELIKAEAAGYPGKPLNKDSWPIYVYDAAGDPAMMLGYMDATDHVVEELRRILKTSTDFATLRKELLTFVIDRRQLSRTLDNEWDEEKGNFRSIDLNKCRTIDFD